MLLWKRVYIWSWSWNLHAFSELTGCGFCTLSSLGAGWDWCRPPIPRITRHIFDTSSQPPPGWCSGPTEHHLHWMAVHPPGWSQGSWNTFFLSLSGTERSNVLAAHIREFCLLFLFRSSSEATSEGRECAHLSAKLNSSCPSWHSPGSQKCCKQRLLFTEWGLCVFSSLLLTSSCGHSASLTAQPKRGNSESEPSRSAPSNEQGLEEYFSWCRVSLPSDLPCIQKPTVIYGMQGWRHGEQH